MTINKLNELTLYLANCCAKYEELLQKKADLDVQKDLFSAQEDLPTEQLKDVIEVANIIEKQLKLILITAEAKTKEYKK